jgi:hypothetical protein
MIPHGRLTRITSPHLTKAEADRLCAEVTAANTHETNPRETAFSGVAPRIMEAPVTKQVAR